MTNVATHEKPEMISELFTVYLNRDIKYTLHYYTHNSQTTNFIGTLQEFMSMQNIGVVPILPLLYDIPVGYCTLVRYRLHSNM